MGRSCRFVLSSRRLRQRQMLTPQHSVSVISDGNHIWPLDSLAIIRLPSRRSTPETASLSLRELGRIPKGSTLILLGFRSSHPRSQPCLALSVWRRTGSRPFRRSLDLGRSCAGGVLTICAAIQGQRVEKAGGCHLMDSSTNPGSAS